MFFCTRFIRTVLIVVAPATHTHTHREKEREREITIIHPRAQLIVAWILDSDRTTPQPQMAFLKYKLLSH